MRFMYLMGIVGVFFFCTSSTDRCRADELTPEQLKAVDRAAAQIEAADAVTWSNQAFMRLTSKDGSRSWLKPMSGPSIMTYLPPSFFRDVRYMPDGSEMLVELVDAESGKSLRINPRDKTAYWVKEPINVYEAKHPFKSLAKSMREHPMEFVRTQEHAGITVDVFRFVTTGRGYRQELWIDTDAGSLVSLSEPRGEPVDLSKVDTEASMKGAKREMAGSVRGPINWNPEIDKTMFELKVPEGYELIDAPALPTAINP